MASPQFMLIGSAPNALNVSIKIGLPTTRTRSPFKSSGVFTSFLLFVIWRKPFSPHASGMTPFSSIAAKIALPVSPASNLSRFSNELIKNGSEKMFFCGRTVAELIVDSNATSITPCATIWNAFNCAPFSSVLPKYGLTIIWPLVFSFTRSANFCAPMPQ